MAHLLQGALWQTLSTTPPLMLPLKLMLLDECANRYMHYLWKQFVLLTALAVITQRSDSKVIPQCPDDWSKLEQSENGKRHWPRAPPPPGRRATSRATTALYPHVPERLGGNTCISISITPHHPLHSDVIWPCAHSVTTAHRKRAFRPRKQCPRTLLSSVLVITVLRCCSTIKGCQKLQIP